MWGSPTHNWMPCKTPSWSSSTIFNMVPAVRLGSIWQWPCQWYCQSYLENQCCLLASQLHAWAQLTRFSWYLSYSLKENWWIWGLVVSFASSFLFYPPHLSLCLSLLNLCLIPVPNYVHKDILTLSLSYCFSPNLVYITTIIYISLAIVQKGHELCLGLEWAPQPALFRAYSWFYIQEITSRGVVRGRWDTKEQIWVGHMQSKPPIQGTITLTPAGVLSETWGTWS